MGSVPAPRQPSRSSISLTFHAFTVMPFRFPQLMWEQALAGAPELPPSQVLRHMGTDIYLQGAPTAPP